MGLAALVSGPAAPAASQPLATSRALTRRSHVKPPSLSSSRAFGGIGHGGGPRAGCSSGPSRPLGSRANVGARRASGVAFAVHAPDENAPSGPLGGSEMADYTLPGEPSYPGLYCDWSVTPEDKVEVWSYRACLSVVAASCLVCASVREANDAGRLGPEP